MTKQLPVLRQARTQKRCGSTGPEGGDSCGGRVPAQDNLHRRDCEDSPDHAFVHDGDPLRPRYLRGTGNLAQQLCSPGRRGHIRERANYQTIIRTGLMVRRTAPITGEDVGRDVWRYIAQTAPRRAGIVVVQTIEDGFACHGADNSLRNA